MILTEDEVRAIREQADAATSGPWDAGTAMCCPDMGWVDGPRGRVCGDAASKRTHSIDANDAEFIASSRSDVPALVASHEEMRARLVKAEDALRFYAGAENYRDGRVGELDWDVTENAPGPKWRSDCGNRARLALISAKEPER